MNNSNDRLYAIKLFKKMNWTYGQRIYFRHLEGGEYCEFMNMYKRPLGIVLTRFAEALRGEPFVTFLDE